MDEFEILFGIALLGALVWAVLKYYANGPRTGALSFNNKKHSALITDKYQTYSEVQEALRKAGLEASNLIVGIDYTRSNEYTGRMTFHGKSLHHLDPNYMNPYQHVISIIGKTLEVFDDDKMIPCYGFGDVTTTDKKVFPFTQHRSCHGLKEVLDKYNEITPVTIMSGPTSFAPIIKEAISIVKQEKSYHILLIIADGQVTSEAETKRAIVEASNYPLSIVLVGVGDGPWDMMRDFDDGLPERKFDNFQFVNFHDFFHADVKREVPELDFAVAALQEIPDQFKEICRLGLL
jgi:hypothetical protein